MWHFLVYVLGAMWAVQQAFKVLGDCTLRSPIAAGPSQADLLLEALPDPATKWQHSRVRSKVDALRSVASKQGGVYCDIWVVYSRRSVASELNVL
mmetsp:Transcript_118813/g.236698  ORF Transcript_118813/g.236698 Transcript_118813/m.236698 type:complete len:95 (-) Transcript_118813:497-781(-)